MMATTVGPLNLQINPNATVLLPSRSQSQTDDEHSDSETIVDEQPPITPLSPIKPSHGVLTPVTSDPKQSNATKSDPTHHSTSQSPVSSQSHSHSQGSQHQPIPDSLNEISDEKSPNLSIAPINTSSSQIIRVSCLAELGYSKCKNIANTLQGKTFLAKHCDDDKLYAIKYAAKQLYAKGITISNEGKAYNIQEDIVAEGHMMMDFMKHNPPNALIKTYDFFEDANYYYLAMEYGGSDFFDFVVNCHQLINEGKLSLKEWRKQCKFMFSQLIECIEWLHEEMHYCHLDISLENILINDNAYFDESTGELNNCLIKLIDFGLAVTFMCIFWIFCIVLFRKGLVLRRMSHSCAKSMSERRITRHPKCMVKRKCLMRRKQTFGVLEYRCL